MVSLLGPARAAVFPALAPGIAALMAWPVLGHLLNHLKLAQGVIAGIESRGAAADPQSGDADWQHSLSVLQASGHAAPRLDLQA